jgi:hypothetical protein
VKIIGYLLSRLEVNVLIHVKQKNYFLNWKNYALHVPIH